MPCYDPRDDDDAKQARAEAGELRALLCAAAQHFEARGTLAPEWPPGLLAWWAIHRREDQERDELNASKGG